MKRGDVVKTVYGEIKKVMSVNESAIYFYDGTWAHPTKCWKVSK